MQFLNEANILPTLQHWSSTSMSRPIPRFFNASSRRSGGCIPVPLDHEGTTVVSSSASCIRLANLCMRPENRELMAEIMFETFNVKEPSRVVSCLVCSPHTHLQSPGLPPLSEQEPDRSSWDFLLTLQWPHDQATWLWSSGGKLQERRAALRSTTAEPASGSLMADAKAMVSGVRK